MASKDSKCLSKCCFLEWTRLEKQSLSELQQVLSPSPPDDDTELTRLVHKEVKQFENYVDRRRQLSKADVACFYAPTWCTPWENSLLWIAGCRPSSFIRLVYALSGLELEAKLEEFLKVGGGGSDVKLGDLSAKQMVLVDGLQRRTIKEEEKLTAKLAGLQEDVADQPIAAIAKKLSQVGEMCGELDKALEEHERAMVTALEEADVLRLNTVKEILEILTPVQAIDFLATSKKLHLSVHEWSKKRDQCCHGPW
ncbi:protein DELAY OF GERMINATION 1 [Humulus lupulus]|uniref:protein DELAY OF GERMINATION 1 n=1 Tax=Humulus lupulus TaxID=3486 RepID=UPI002B40F31A|nr:protein DELAY OF GERMINATION 1 [Humulus lupulus]